MISIPIRYSATPFARLLIEGFNLSINDNVLAKRQHRLGRTLAEKGRTLRRLVQGRESHAIGVRYVAQNVA